MVVKYRAGPLSGLAAYWVGRAGRAGGAVGRRLSMENKGDDFLDNFGVSIWGSKLGPKKYVSLAVYHRKLTILVCYIFFTVTWPLVWAILGHLWRRS